MTLNWSNSSHHDETCHALLPLPAANLGRSHCLALCLMCHGESRACGQSPSAANSDAVAQKLLTQSGVQGGLIVHLGCGDGSLTNALRPNDRYVVHGLDSDAAAIDAGRTRLQSENRYGDVTLDVWDARRLPYADNVVNLIVAEDVGGISQEELLRVLCPLGVVCTHDGDGWTTIVKPRPSEIDEWTHYMHGPDNNAVAPRLGRRTAAAHPVDWWATMGPRT